MYLTSPCGRYKHESENGPSFAAENTAVGSYGPEELVSEDARHDLTYRCRNYWRVPRAGMSFNVAKSSSADDVRLWIGWNPTGIVATRDGLLPLRPPWIGNVPVPSDSTGCHGL